MRKIRVELNFVLDAFRIGVPTAGDHAGQSDEQPKRVALQELKTWNRPRDDDPYHHAGQRNRIERLLPWRGNQRDAQYGQAQDDSLVAFGQHFRRCRREDEIADDADPAEFVPNRNVRGDVTHAASFPYEAIWC